jgi:hypothetical protein
MLLPGDQKAKKHMPTAADLINTHADYIEDLLIRINRLEENQKLVFSSAIDLQNRVSLLEGEHGYTES